MVRRLIASIPGVRWLWHRFLRLPFLGNRISRRAPPGRLFVSRASDRGAPPAVDRMRLLDRYRGSPLAAKPDTFVFYRIIGNDLPPRHRSGQTRRNLAFILSHEPELPGCEKRFVVNRIVDPVEEAAVLALLDDAGVPYIHIPFDPDAYRLVPWDVAGVPPDFAPCSLRFRRLSEARQARVLMRLYRHKNNYVMNNNGARNAALREGRGLAKWILPWDGNCFVSADAWREITTAVRETPELPCFLVPMARVTDNALLLDAGFRPVAEEEPQILFRRDTGLEFDETFSYGRRPKVELLWRLGVPGIWDEWGIEPWDLPCPPYADAAGAYGRAGWVARLFSGQAHMEGGATQAASGHRVTARMRAIRGLLDELDERIMPAPDRAQPCLLQPERELPASLATRLRAAAEAALGRGPYSVLDKRSLPPSGDRHDYWHPAPYYWPHPLRLPGLAYVRRDGRRVPGTRLFEAGSERYDRSSLQRLFDDSFVLALAWRHGGDRRYGEHAAALVRRWFIDPATAMNPHLEYAQVRRGHDGNRGSSSGIIEMKDLYYFLDGVRLLQGAGFLDAREQGALQEWLGRYLHWLRSSGQGIEARAALNNQGTYYDLQVVALAAFLGETRLLRETLRDSRSRLLQQIDGDGGQPEEMGRATSLHYCCFNLQGWVNLALYAEAWGEDLWSFSGSDGRGLRRALRYLSARAERDWPGRQIDAFDPARLAPLHHAMLARYGLPADSLGSELPPAERIEPLFSPYDGIMPFWQLAGWSRARHAE
jgi:hypothetical protein